MRKIIILLFQKYKIVKVINLIAIINKIKWNENKIKLKEFSFVKIYFIDKLNVHFFITKFRLLFAIYFFLLFDNSMFFIFLVISASS